MIEKVDASKAANAGIDVDSCYAYGFSCDLLSETVSSVVTISAGASDIVRQLALALIATAKALAISASGGYEGPSGGVY